MLLDNVVENRVLGVVTGVVALRIHIGKLVVSQMGVDVDVQKGGPLSGELKG